MSSLIHQLKTKSLIQPPPWLPNNMVLEVIMGSYAYGVSNDNSDMDVYGVCIPPKGILFPHTEGYLVGFDRNIPTFDQFQKHGIVDPSALMGKGQEYDVTVYNIVKYFQLAADNNPNIIDSLFVPYHCVKFSSPVGQMIREAREMFLHKGMWSKFKGYAYAQLHKCDIKTPKPGSKRAEDVERIGFDSKYTYHVVRLIGEVEQALSTGTIDLQQDAERLKAIRRGEWSLDDVKQFFTDKERDLEHLYVSSQLPRKPDMVKLRRLLLDCLEHHYGSLGDAFVDVTVERKALKDIELILQK